MPSITPSPNGQPNWSKHPRVVLIGPPDRANVVEEIERSQPLILAHAEIVDIDLGWLKRYDDVALDFAIVFGGDGSILRAAKQFSQRPVPVLGVNLGRLGFLADLTPADFREALPSVCEGKCRIVEHLMLRCEVWRGETLLVERIGLNETAVLAGPPFSMLTAELYVDSILATTYSCDGLIVSTPVGSTAHSLSAGGPILRKNLQAFVISPISPHTLTVRPVVDSAERVLEIIVRQPNASTSVVVDGEVLCQLQPNDVVRVRRAVQTFPMIEAPGHNYYRTLREKLGWGGNLPSTRKS